ncbi:MAG: XisI protein [Cyanobacteria bacterium CRU_2_1]|nr:XisI protein [Cyanobacteria bacterium RU_5_0]NJR61334.1 XisI protein [Cyanobacteria bacterium CRU_2_1]
MTVCQQFQNLIIHSFTGFRSCQLVQVGWQNNRRVYGCILHLDIKDGKIWLQHNGTERQVADELVALGVPKQDIVLGFQSPSKRKFTEFAIG